MYSIRFEDDAIRDFEKLDKSVAKRIARKLDWLSEKAEAIQHLGLRGELTGLAKLREGDYRIIYELLTAERIIVIYFVGHRSEVYKR